MISFTVAFSAHPAIASCGFVLDIDKQVQKEALEAQKNLIALREATRLALVAAVQKGALHLNFDVGDGLTLNIPQEQTLSLIENLATWSSDFYHFRSLFFDQQEYLQQITATANTLASPFFSPNEFLDLTFKNLYAFIARNEANIQRVAVQIKPSLDIDEDLSNADVDSLRASRADHREINEFYQKIERRVTGTELSFGFTEILDVPPPTEKSPIGFAAN